MTEADWSHDVGLDVRGLACPLPVLKARKALIGMAPGKRLLVETTDRSPPSTCPTSAARPAIA
jgi:tRNA 2-thiouridine synthesizing protein A